MTRPREGRLAAWRDVRREVSVAGLARSGEAAARLLHAHDIPVYASDASDTAASREVASRLALPGGAPLGVQLGSHDLARVARSVALIVSPGIAPNAPVVAAARDAGVPVLAEAALGLDALADVPTVVVTGTNGKTTTTALVGHLLRTAGQRAVDCGNIGRPISDVALDADRPDWLAVELSSFQLHDMPDRRPPPTIGVLTNLEPDHLDRYASVDEYYGDKARLFANATSESVWITNHDSAISQAMVRQVRGRPRTFAVARSGRADAWFDHEGQHLMLNGTRLLGREQLHLLGDHNVANALAAALAADAAGVARESIAGGLTTFAPLPHRLQAIREVDGVRWINDSKATNVASARAAIEAMDRPFVLMLGGRHKGEPYRELVGPLCRFATAVVAYGESAALVEADLAPSLRVVRGTSFDDAVAKARVLASAGGAVLLSPACSSYDQFDNYIQRGEHFRELVEAM